MNPKSIQFGDDFSGIVITHIEDRAVIEVSGWCDHIGVIEPHEMPFAEFKERLGIS